MRVTRWAEYGVLFSIYLARQPRDSTIGAAEIAEALSIPIEYTQQILQRLRKGGIIDSVRGPKGGYKLSRPSPEINLKEILLAAEGVTFEIICETKPISESCSNLKEQCALHGIWHELKDSIDGLLETKTLDKLSIKSIFDGDKLVNIHSHETESLA